MQPERTYTVEKVTRANPEIHTEYLVTLYYGTLSSTYYHATPEQALAQVEEYMKDCGGPGTVKSLRTVTHLQEPLGRWLSNDAKLIEAAWVENPTRKHGSIWVTVDGRIKAFGLTTKQAQAIVNEQAGRPVWTA